MCSEDNAALGPTSGSRRDTAFALFPTLFALLPTLLAKMALPFALAKRLMASRIVVVVGEDYVHMLLLLLAKMASHGALAAKLAVVTNVVGEEGVRLWLPVRSERWLHGSDVVVAVVVCQARRVLGSQEAQAGTEGA
jgi:hypothetical protein